MRRVRLLIVLLCSLAALPLHAQVRLDGIVIDDATGAPIPEARVELYDGWGTLSRVRLTDSLGNFQLPIRRLGAYRVRVRSRGYPDVSGVLLSGGFVFQNVEVRMRKGAQLLSPITLLTRTQTIPAGQYLGFHERLRGRRGSYITREDVEGVRPGYVSDMIAWTPGVVIRRVPDSDDRLLHARRVVDGQVVECPMRVFVDGEMVNPRREGGELGGASVDGTVDQTMVYGIEIYVNPALVPAEFRADGRCGAVLIWTRTGSANASSRAASAGG